MFRSTRPMCVRRWWRRSRRRCARRCPGCRVTTCRCRCRSRCSVECQVVCAGAEAGGEVRGGPPHQVHHHGRGGAGHQLQGRRPHPVPGGQPPGAAVQAAVQDPACAEASHCATGRVISKIQNWTTKTSSKFQEVCVETPSQKCEPVAVQIPNIITKNTC